MFMRLLMLVISGVVLWGAFKLEPHWSSKDGLRMIARVQSLNQHNVPEGRWHEVRITIDDRILQISARSKRATFLRGDYQVMGKSSEPPKKREVYIIQGSQRVLLRIPSKSHSVAVLDLLTDTTI